MQDLDKIIWRDALTLVDFFASWCGPCRMMHPVIDRFKEEMHGRADVYKVDIDDRDTAEFTARYRIASVPTLIFFRRGEVLWRSSGVIGYSDLAGVLEEQGKPLTEETAETFAAAVLEELEKTERVEQS